MPYDVVQLRELARSLAIEAGELIVSERPADLGVAGTKSSPIDIVTEMDTASERLLRSRIKAARPDDGVLGEEGGLTHGTSGLTWVIDPIDGTVNYLYGLPHFAVSVAVVAGDPLSPDATALAGCVHAPMLSHTWVAAQGMGAARDGVALRRAPGPEPAFALVATGFGYRRDRREVQGEIVAELIGEIRDIRRLGSAAIDLCLVADGRIDGHFERGLNAWDYAAGTLIAKEAGCEVLGLGSRPPGPDMVVTAPPVLARWLAGRLEDLDAARDTAQDG